MWPISWGASSQGDKLGKRLPTEKCNESGDLDTNGDVKFVLKNAMEPSQASVTASGDAGSRQGNCHAASMALSVSFPQVRWIGICLISVWLILCFVAVPVDSCLRLEQGAEPDFGSVVLHADDKLLSVLPSLDGWSYRNDGAGADHDGHLSRSCPVACASEACRCTVSGTRQWKRSQHRRDLDLTITVVFISSWQQQYL